MVGGTFGAVVGLRRDYRGEAAAGSWSCKDNSGSS